MCSVGDAFNVDVAETLNAKDYQCKDCGNVFQGMGKKVKCPTCHSQNVEIK